AIAVAIAVWWGAAGCRGCKKETPAPEPLCAAASTCSERHYCNASRTCRCLKSAEGEIRCGEPPSCGVQQCTRSSDCANLGADYFCDSPGSGCCGDTKQRCIRPCSGETCPEARICGATCCLAGETCVGGRCAGGSDGGVSVGHVDGGTPAAL